MASFDTIPRELVQLILHAFLHLVSVEALWPTRKVCRTWHNIVNAEMAKLAAASFGQDGEARLEVRPLGHSALSTVLQKKKLNTSYPLIMYLYRFWLCPAPSPVTTLASRRASITLTLSLASRILNAHLPTMATRHRPPPPRSATSLTYSN